MTLRFHKYIKKRATELRAEGSSSPYKSIKEELGIPLSSDAIRKWDGRDLRTEGDYTSKKYDDVFESAIGLKSFGIQEEISQSPDPVEATERGERVFEHLKEQAREKEAHIAENPEGEVTLEVDTRVPIMIVPFSDWHLGSEDTDYDQLEKHIDLVANTEGAYATFGGDGVDNFIKHKSAMINRSPTTPEEQYALLVYLMERLDPIAVITGNHDWWTKQFAGIDYLRTQMRERGINYAPHRLLLTVVLNGTVNYRIEHRHQYRFKSSINLSNQLQRMWERSDWEWDVGVVGHTHDGPFHFPFFRHDRERWGGICGAYKVRDGHSRQRGYKDAKPNSPCFILHPDEYRVDGFNTIERGVEYLRALRSMYNET